MNMPYKACQDEELLGELESLNSTYLHLDEVDVYGGLELTLTSYKDSDVKVHIYLDEDGLRFDEHLRFEMNKKTLILLSTMSAAYAAGYAAARQAWQHKPSEQ